MRGLVRSMLIVAAGALFLTACGRRQEGRAPYLPLAAIERTYGALVSAGNHPTADQHGTGERVGLFLDAAGTVWGLPIAIGADGSVSACAPDGLRNGRVTDGLPPGWTIVGSTNGPTGWRGGTGELELLLRDGQGTVRRRSVQGADFPAGPACWAAESPGPPQRLHYYRLAPRAD
jgi:hypothetical protein